MNYREIANKLAEELAKTRVYCKCGHSINVPKFRKYKVCTWCGNLVFTDKKEEFKYRLNETMTREKVREYERDIK